MHFGTQNPTIWVLGPSGFMRPQYPIFRTSKRKSIPFRTLNLRNDRGFRIPGFRVSGFRVLKGSWDLVTGVIIQVTILLLTYNPNEYL